MMLRTEKPHDLRYLSKIEPDILTGLYHVDGTLSGALASLVTEYYSWALD